MGGGGRWGEKPQVRFGGGLREAAEGRTRPRLSRARRTEQNVQRGLESAHTLTVWGSGVAEPRPVRSPTQPGPGGAQQSFDQQGPSPL